MFAVTIMTIVLSSGSWGASLRVPEVQQILATTRAEVAAEEGPETEEDVEKVGDFIRADQWLLVALGLILILITLWLVVEAWLRLRAIRTGSPT